MWFKFHAFIICWKIKDIGEIGSGMKSVIIQTTHNFQGIKNLAILG
jgi:hypothetical protein